MAAEPDDESSEGESEEDDELGPAERRCGISLGGDDPADDD